MKQVFLTNDVEPLSINGQVCDDIALGVLNDALPRLLALYAKYNVHATFYCLSSFVSRYPDIVRMIHEAGHEVACHGLVHDKDKAFDILSLEQQIAHLSQAKTDIQAIIPGLRVVSFRAPALRVNGDTPQALMAAGFLTDSSVAPQRLDAFMSLGSRKKLQWIRAPRAIYHTSTSNLARRGDSSIIEAPVSAFALPYIGTLMRISPFLCRITRYLLYLETRGNNSKVVNFLYHPSEAVPETDEERQPLHRSDSWIGHLFSDVLRTKLKSRNLGPESLTLLEREIAFWHKKGYQFLTVNSLCE